MSAYTAKIRPRLGKHQSALLEFCIKYPGPHCLTVNRSDPARKERAS